MAKVIAKVEIKFNITEDDILERNKSKKDIMEDYRGASDDSKRTFLEKIVKDMFGDYVNITLK